MKKGFLHMLLMFNLCQGLIAQSPTAKRDYDGNHMFWLSVPINGVIKGNWRYQLDVEFRRQADPQHAYKVGDKVDDDHWNIFKNPYQYGLRPFVHYILNENVRFSWSPITWFGNWTFPVNDKVFFTPEFRTSPQVTLFQFIGKVQIQQRYRLEYRFFGKPTEVSPRSENPFGPWDSYNFHSNSSADHFRFRYQFRVVVPFNAQKLEKGTHYLAGSCELFIKFGKNVNTNYFDQTRTYIMYGYKFHKDMRFEIGYLNQIAFRLNNGLGFKGIGNNVDLNNNLAFTFFIDDLNDLLSKKDKEKKHHHFHN